MPRNVEIKARVANLLMLKDKASELSSSFGTILNQIDTYFKVNKGRFKLREIEGSASELVYYERDDVEGPKFSNYTKQNFKDSKEVEGLKTILSQSLGIRGCVRKQRSLFMVDQTRVHVDQVQGLGNFMELEVMLKDDQTIGQGQKIAEDLMESLGIEKNSLISGSYIDMLVKEGLF